MRSHPHLSTKRTALYRLYDAAGVLLYVGITHDPDARWASHAATKPWWGDVERRVLEWHDSRDAAEVAEVETIRTELPRYNVAASPLAPGPRTLDSSELPVSEAKGNLSSVARRVASGRLVWLVGRGRARTRQAALVPVEIGELVDQAGGPDAAAAILREHAAK
ncbi:GIY-YIG nuclease family protein [Streptomyces indicus]|uniref:GIY-YIG catalytic domain-containing protein n=1 Tax=Streptomyces indicus TaxID=417292 RepID=A0A1G9J8H1_9ACTN|nr:GIY-YIG nuclease family protein [Streptomyces indicus]SDL33444.1 GIY-YIG catalytic domain-containing protein [Streptomyces indicus]